MYVTSFVCVWIVCPGVSLLSHSLTHFFEGPRRPTRNQGIPLTMEPFRNFVRYALAKIAKLKCKVGTALDKKELNFGSQAAWLCFP